jgi:hypothetical protein
MRRLHLRLVGSLRAMLLLAFATTAGCGEKQDTPEVPPLFAKADADAARQLQGEVAGQTSMQPLEASVRLFLKASPDSLTAMDEQRVIKSMMMRNPAEVGRFLRTAPTQFRLNSAFLPQGEEARMVQLEIPGFAATTLTLRRIGSRDATSGVYEGVSDDQGVNMTFFSDSVIVGEITSRGARFQFRSGEYGEIVFLQDTTSYVPEAPPLVPRRRPTAARDLPLKAMKRAAEAAKTADASKGVDKAAEQAATCTPRDLTFVVGVVPALATASNRALLQAEIQRAVAEASQVFAESAIVGSITATVIFLDANVLGSSESVLRELEAGQTRPSRALRDAVVARRATGGLLLLSEVDDGACGRAFVLEKNVAGVPFGYVLRRCLNKKSLAHELTHLLGANHQSPDTPRFSNDSYGYRNVTADFRTIESTCPENTQCLDRFALLSDYSRPLGRSPKNPIPRGATVANSAKAFRESMCTLTRGK